MLTAVATQSTAKLKLNTVSKEILEMDIKKIVFVEIKFFAEIKINLWSKTNGNYRDSWRSHVIRDVVMFVVSML